MTGRLLRSIAGVAAAWLLSAGIASAQAPVLAQPGVSGNTVHLLIAAVWRRPACPTRLDRLDAGVASGAYLWWSVSLGNV